MAAVKFLNVVAKDGQTAAERFAAMTKEQGVFYKVADVGEEVHYYLEGQLISADKAAEISVLDAEGVFTAGDVEGVLSELFADQLDKTIWFHDDSAGQSEYAKVYHLYQGANDYVPGRTDGKPNPVLKGTINTPKDLVVRAGSVVVITFDATEGKLYDGAVDVTELIVPSGSTPSADFAGKYLKLEVQNQDDPIYINVKDLVDLYTGGTNVEATVAIDEHNEITVTIGKVAATKSIYAEATYYTQEEYDAYVAEHGEAPSWNVGDIKTTEINVRDKIDDVEEGLTALGEYVGEIPPTSEATTVIGYVDEKTQGGVSSLNGEAGVASNVSNVVTIKGGIIEVEGIIQNAPNADKPSTEDVYWDAAGSGKIYSDPAMTIEVTPVTTKTYIDLVSGKHINWVGNRFVDTVPDVVLEKVAVTGAAEDVSIADAGDLLEADNVEDAIQELATALTWQDV